MTFFKVIFSILDARILRGSFIEKCRVANTWVNILDKGVCLENVLHVKFTENMMSNSLKSCDPKIFLFFGGGR